MKKTVLLLLIAFALFSTPASAQRLDYASVDLNALIDETQLSVGTGDNLEMHLWMPMEFWKVSMAEDPSLDKGDIDDFLKVLEPYTMVAVIDGKFGVLGSVNYENVDTIRANYRMMDKTGKLHAPLEESDLNNEVQLLLSLFKPMMSSMMGDMGDNLQFFVFNNKDKKGKEIFSPYAKESTRVSYKGRIHNWKTPFGALLEKKKCPTDDELHDGSWDYCPYHGVKLEKQ